MVSVDGTMRTVVVTLAAPGPPVPISPPVIT